MATASPKQVRRDGCPDCSPERYAEAFEEKHALPLHQTGGLRSYPPVTAGKPLPYPISAPCPMRHRSFTAGHAGERPDSERVIDQAEGTFSVWLAVNR